MLKKFILIFAFLIIAQAIAYCQSDTIWVKNDVKAFILKFSITGDSIICYSQKDSNRIQIRSTATGNILREFPIKYSITDLILSPNGKKIYMGLTYSDPHGAFTKWPMIVSLSLQTGDTNVIIRSDIPNDTNMLSTFLHCYIANHLSISKDENYLTANIYWVEYLGSTWGIRSILFDISNKKATQDLGFAIDGQFAMFSPTENYFALPREKIKLIKPEPYETLSILDKIPSANYSSYYLSFSPDGSKLINFSVKKIDIWNLTTKKEQDSILYYQPIEMSFFPNGKHILTKNNLNLSWVVFNSESKDSVFSFPKYIETMDISPNMNYLIEALNDSNIVLIETPLAITSRSEPKTNNLSINIFPNPFSESATISYSLPTASQVKLSIYDIFGREVAVLADGWQEAGMHREDFRFQTSDIRSQGSNIEHRASNIESGIYFCRIQSKDYNQTIKFVVIR
jgi:hypothetical protein